MSLDNILIGLTLLVAVAALVVIIRRRRAGIGFKTLDEVTVVQELMYWVADKVPAELRTQFLLGSTLMPRGIVALQSITREELAILAP